MNDLLIRNKEGVTQIDHVVLSKYGIFIIETKDYQGLITGTEHAERWSQHLNGKEYHFYNPLKQNYAHAMAINQATGISMKRFVPIIAFSERATLHVESTKPVVNFRNLLFAIEYFKKVRITDSDLKEAILVLKKSHIESDKIMMLHNNVIKAKEKESEAKKRR